MTRNQRTGSAARSWTPEGTGHAIYLLHKFGETQKAVHVGRRKADRETSASFWLPKSQIRIIADVADRTGNTLEVSVPEWLAKRNSLDPHVHGRGYAGNTPAPAPAPADHMIEDAVADYDPPDDPGDFAPYPDDYSGRDYDPAPPDGYVPMDYDPDEYEGGRDD